MKKLEAGWLAAGIWCNCLGENIWLSLVRSELEMETKNRDVGSHQPSPDCLGGLLSRFAL